uniref:Helitron helicase-like domain-containing protein n=1 Tax=Ditylenchus dipsaci TaxID=166011 RepID=A0A915E219_9BILA
MAMVRRYGKPSLFVTFTCNPNWPAIKRNLLPGNTVLDEPDLVCRVFNLYLKDLLEQLLKFDRLGKVIAHTYVVEFQKRGLPHAHILLIMDNETQIRTPEDIDKIVSARIPDPKKFPRLHKTVTRDMMHGPCGILKMDSVCMAEDKQGKRFCSKRFPKEFRSDTAIGNDSYALYARPKDGRTFEKNGVTMDNRWVVPYNEFLCLRYDAHINVEVCASVRSVKYLYKYVYKGHDKARMVIEKDGKDVIDHDEIRQFVDMRYVSPHEGFWRLFELNLDGKSHTVERLDLHLPDKKVVYYKPGEDIETKLKEVADRDSMITAWYAVLKLCGKTSIISTKQSALMRVFLTNAEKVYRLVIWKDKIDEVYDKLKIGNVIKLTSLKATSFFKTENDIFPSNLNVNFDLVYTSTSTMSVLKKGTFEEYPSLNPYPPFWKEISGLIRSDEEIVMRVVLIGSFTADQLKIGEVEHEGFSAFVGDKSHKKVFIFVVKTSEIDDQDFVDSLVKNTEFYVSGAKAIEKSCGQAALFVSSFDYVSGPLASEIKLPLFFESHKFPEEPLETPKKKMRRSFI